MGMLKMMDSTASLNYADSASPSKLSHRGQSRTLVVELAAKKFTLDEFDHFHVLGRGSFGQVTLVRHRATDELYALK